MKKMTLTLTALFALGLAGCSDKGSEENKGAQVEHAQAPAGEAKQAPAPAKAEQGAYDPTKDEDGDC